MGRPKKRDVGKVLPVDKPSEESIVRLIRARLEELRPLVQEAVDLERIDGLIEQVRRDR